MAEFFVERYYPSINDLYLGIYDVEEEAKEFKETFIYKQSPLKLKITDRETSDNILNVAILYNIFEFKEFDLFAKLNRNGSWFSIALIPHLLFDLNLIELDLDSNDIRPEHFCMIITGLAFNIKTEHYIYEKYINSYKNFKGRFSKLTCLRVKHVLYEMADFDFNIDLHCTMVEHMLNNNPILKELELPENIKDDVRIINAMDKSYTILKTNSYMNSTALYRNNFLRYKTMKLVMVFLAIRNRRQSILRHLDKNIVLLVAKMIWDFKSDVNHLQILNIRCNR
jgi:hypothetical protein